MARTKRRRVTRPAPKRDGTAGRRDTSKRYRRPPWYRRAAPWIAIAAAAAGIAAVAMLLANRGEREAAAEAHVGGDLHSLVVEAASGRLYVGGHDGVAASNDGGRTWRQIDSLDGADAMGWAFTDDAILVGGHPGVFVSTDGGRTFERRNEGLPATDVHALGSDGTTIYAASPQIGILASSDDGSSWEVLTKEVGQSFMGRILVDPLDPKHLVAPDVRAGAAESTDGGRTWSSLGGVRGAIWVSWESADPEHLIVSGPGVASETTDGGATWTELAVPRGASIIEIDPEDAETLYAAVHQGDSAIVWRSHDGGMTWGS